MTPAQNTRQYNKNYSVEVIERPSKHSNTSPIGNVINKNYSIDVIERPSKHSNTSSIGNVINITITHK